MTISSGSRSSRTHSVRRRRRRSRARGARRPAGRNAEHQSAAGDTCQFQETAAADRLLIVNADGGASFEAAAKSARNESLWYDSCDDFITHSPRCAGSLRRHESPCGCASRCAQRHKLPAIASIDVGVGRLRLLLQQRGRGHDLARLAVAALRYVEIDPSLLQRMQRSVCTRQTFDRRHRAFGGGDRAERARAHRLAVDPHRARAALADAAAVFRADEIQVDRAAPTTTASTVRRRR